jgi:hypothetical protein
MALFLRAVAYRMAPADPRLLRAVVRRIDLLDPPDRPEQDRELHGLALTCTTARLDRVVPPAAGCWRSSSPERRRPLVEDPGTDSGRRLCHTKRACPVCLLQALSIPPQPRAEGRWATMQWSPGTGLTTRSMAKLTAPRRTRVILAGRTTSVPFTAVLHGCERTTTDNPKLPRPAPLLILAGEDPGRSGFASKGS